MNKRSLKIISFSSLLLLGLLGILNIWDILSLGEITTKIMITLGIVFVVSTIIYEILQKENKK